MQLIHPQMNVTQPVLVRLLALTAWMYLAMAAGPLVPAARAGAITNAYGGGAGIDVPDDFEDPHMGKMMSGSLFGNKGDNGSWSAFATAFGPGSFINYDNVELKAEANAEWLGVSSNQRPGGAAFAEWTDKLKFENPDVIVDQRAFTTGFVYYRPHVDGTISGRGSARWTVNVGDQSGGFDFDAPGLNVGNLEFPIRFMDLKLDLVPLTMTLFASAPTFPDSLVSEALFSNTAVLPQLILADANGNYVPGSELLRIVGESGLEYSVAAVPEPATAALLAMCGVSLLSFRGHRCRIG